MFGHQDDVIAQDQKRDADVTIPESALDALTGPPDSGSTPPPSVTPADASDNTESTPDAATDTPNLAPTSVAGFAAPNTKLTTPFSYMQNNTSDDSDDTQTDSTAPEATEPSEQIEQQSENALFGANEPEHDDEKAAADYLDNLIANNPHPDSTTNTQDAPDETNASDEDTMDEPSESEDEAASEEPVVVEPFNADHLLSIKQEALTELSPLVGQLNLSPEEKFNTIMMLIRASDNETLIGDAYDAAKNIADEKLRAQALLDVVNEINYFTGHEAVAA